MAAKIPTRIPNVASRTATAIPRPAGIFDPVARALEVMGDRWTLVLVRHLLGGDRGFQELRVRTGIAPEVPEQDLGMGRRRKLVGALFPERLEVRRFEAEGLGLRTGLLVHVREPAHLAPGCRRDRSPGGSPGWP